MNKKIIRILSLIEEAKNLISESENLISELEKDLENEVKKINEITNEQYSRPISDLKLSSRAKNCLKKRGIQTIEELIRLTDLDLKRLPNIGNITFIEISNKLSAIGLHLADETAIRKHNINEVLSSIKR